MSFREKRKRVMKLSIFLSLNCVVVGRTFRIMISIIGRGGGSRLASANFAYQNWTLFLTPFCLSSKP